MLAIIQARLNSKRLPNKVLQKIGDKTIIEHCIERTKKLKGIDKVVVAVSNEILDNEIMESCNARIFVPYYIPPNDLLRRYLMCGIAYNADYILRICADAPFFSISAAEELIEKQTEDFHWGVYYRVSYDYIAHYLRNYTAKNQVYEEYPTIWQHSTGKYLEVVRLSALFDVFNRLKSIEKKKIQYIYGELNNDDCYKQHPTSGIYLNPERYKIKKIEIDSLPEHNLAINTESDLERIRGLYDKGMIK